MRERPDLDLPCGLSMTPSIAMIASIGNSDGV
jgi:hypothetical protein